MAITIVYKTGKQRTHFGIRAFSRVTGGYILAGFKGEEIFVQHSDIADLEVNYRGQ